MKNELSDYDIMVNIRAGRKWHDTGMTPPKGERMEMSQENFYRVIEMRDELIMEQKAEISTLKDTINRLQQKVNKKRQPFEGVWE